MSAPPSITPRIRSPRKLKSNVELTGEAPEWRSRKSRSRSQQRFGDIARAADQRRSVSLVGKSGRDSAKKHVLVQGSLTRATLRNRLNRREVGEDCICNVRLNAHAAKAGLRGSLAGARRLISVGIDGRQRFSHRAVYGRGGRRCISGAGRGRKKPPKLPGKPAAATAVAIAFPPPVADAAAVAVALPGRKKKGRKLTISGRTASGVRRGRCVARTRGGSGAARAGVAAYASKQVRTAAGTTIRYGRSRSTPRSRTGRCRRRCKSSVSPALVRALIDAPPIAAISANRSSVRFCWA